MRLVDVMQEIEQYRFSSELNLAAGTKAFRRGLRGHDLFRNLVELAKDPAARATVAQRVEELAQNNLDAQYENRYDTALSAYLTALGDTAPPDLLVKAASAAAKAPNIWWTVTLSRELITQAVATGVAQPAAAAHLIPQALLKRVQWQKTIRNYSETGISANDDAEKQILRPLRTAEEKVQVPQTSNALVMPAPIEEGALPIWRPRSRQRRKPGTASTPHPRARQVAHA